MTSRISVIGAGAFGTALAAALARDGQKITLFGRDQEQMSALKKARCNNRYLPNIQLPENIQPTSRIDDTEGSDVLLLVLPAQKLRAFLKEHEICALGSSVALCAKGIERETGKLQTEILAEFCPNLPSSVITGPGFASDIAGGKPTALTLACADETLANHLQSVLSRPLLRLYRSNDPTGAQLGGALKNVIAIACGVAVGAGMGESARAALLTRGFAEMSRLAVAMGGQMDTLTGLSGLGDLALTCGSAQSRNFAFGLTMAAGKQEESGATVEGIASARACQELAMRRGVEMPIANVVAEFLAGNLTITEALKTLMSRPLIKEH